MAWPTLYLIGSEGRHRVADMWYETWSLNFMEAPRYVGPMVSIRSLSDFELQLINLQGLDYQKPFLGWGSWDMLRV